MIKIIEAIKEEPYEIFYSFYKKALAQNQKNIEAIAISSFDAEKKESNSRYVNLKFIKRDKWIFFTNYNSPKAKEFSQNNLISALLYWSSINTQIRIKAKIKRTSNEFNQNYFFERSKEKNALAISSNQSNQIGSYQQVINNYNESFKNDDLNKCPDYWGGYSFIPYYFEFWEGHESRLNKRLVYKIIDGNWSNYYLQP